jgi:serine/threonine-protein kinase
VQVQNYDVVEELFSAGPSTFFRARNRILGSPVRLRRLAIDPARPDDARDTFYREMRLCAELWHPRIQRPTDVLEADGYLWSVHPYDETRPTADLVKDRGTLSMVDVARMGAQTADALAHMHSKEVLHAKVSPLTVHVDQNGDVQVVNLVKAADLAAGKWPLRPAVLGISPFTAPEEFRGERPNTDTDLYGLAATVVYWLTGRFPRGGDTAEEAMERAAAGAPAVSVRELRADVPAALADVLDAALEADPGRRYGSPAAIGSLLSELQRRLAAEVPPGFESGTRLEMDGEAQHVEIVGRHGAGAFGVVLKARSLSTGTLLAVKTLKHEHRDDHEALERFLREARALQEIEHPNVVRIVGVGETRGTPFAVMEFVSGPDLATVLMRDGALPTERAARLGAGIARGLEAVHRHGIIHRDLKPHNILVAASDRPVIADFGVARAAGNSRLTGTGHLVGTLAYMAPEQFDETPSSPSVDLYALGAILHEMLTGDALFPTKDAVSTIRAIREQPPSPLPADVPGELAAVTLRLLAKDPAQRYAKAGQVAEALEAISSPALAS